MRIYKQAALQESVKRRKHNNDILAWLPAEHGVAGLALADGTEASTSAAAGGYELALADSEGGGGGGKILGSRDFARYYRQNHKPQSRNKQTHLAALQQRQVLHLFFQQTGAGMQKAKSCQSLICFPVHPLEHCLSSILQLHEVLCSSVSARLCTRASHACSVIVNLSKASIVRTTAVAQA